MPNYTTCIVDPQGHPVPAGIPGHMLFSGAGIANGYINNPGLTAEQFPVNNLASNHYQKQGWSLVHLSSNHGYLCKSDGSFMLQACIDGDTQTKLRGLHIDMLDIETNLAASAGGSISNAVAHIRKPKCNDSSSKFLVAHVVLDPEAVACHRSLSEQALFLHKVVEDLCVLDYMHPAVIIPINALPLSHHSKVDRRAISKLSINQVPLPHALPPQQVPGTAILDNEAQSKMKDIWYNILGEAIQVHTVDATSDFFLVGGNSLLLLQVQGDLCKQFNLDVPLAELFKNSTLAKMAALLEGKGSQDGTAIDWPSEIRVQPGIIRLRAPNSPQPRTGLVVALTGATGFLGLELVQQLLRLQEVETVHAIAVRNVGKLSNIHSSKLVIHGGDLSKPQLGMSEGVLAQVFQSADTVIHNGADVSFLKAYGSVRATNLESTKDIVRLALEHGHVQQLHYVSTAGIATMLTQDLYEQSIGSFPPPFSPEGYVLTKWASELYLERASAATGLSVTVHRPTAIVGRNAPHLDVMSNILPYSRKMETVPSMSALEGSFQFVPVEKVAGDLLRTVLAGRPTGAAPTSVQYQNHNGLPEDTISVHGLAPYLSKQLGKAVTVTPDPEWIQKAKAAGMADEVVAYMNGVNLADRKGEKWTFPRAVKGQRS